MGYYTSFKLSITPDDSDKLAEIIDGDRDTFYALDSDGYPSDPCKWYEWQTDMKKVSLANQDIVLHLLGEGEENGDLWKADFWRGQMQLRPAEITYPPFDPTFGGQRG